MLPRVLDACKRHSSKERAKLRRYAALLTGNSGEKRAADIQLSTSEVPE